MSPTPEWPEPDFIVRMMALDRSGGRCEICGKRPAAEWSHRQLRAQGGTWAPSNCQMICNPCHTRVHKNPNWATSIGAMIPSHDNPPTTPAYMPTRSMFGHQWFTLDNNWGMTHHPTPPQGTQP